MSKFMARILLLLICLTLCAPMAGAAESGKLSEHEVKAAFLFNFIKYVEWPPTAIPRENTYLTICIVGKSPLNDVIESLAGKTVKNRKLVIKLLSRIEDLGECNILFINASVKSSLPQLFAATAGRSILTVSDSKGFATAGGIIEFVPVKDKIRFEINNRVAQQINLRLSSHLLKLATRVIE
jgi:hypothetical protein